MLSILCVALMVTIGRCTGDQSFVTKTVRVGEDVTLTCCRQSGLTGYLGWIRLVVGKLPEVLGMTYTYDHATIRTIPRITIKQEPGTFVLSITRTELSDTAFYYCEQAIELQRTLLNITFLRVEGPEANITTVIQNASDPVRPGDSVTLRCSVISGFQKERCPEDPSVYWFRAGADGSHLTVIYAHRNRSDQCERSPEALSPQRCVYSFSKTVSSSDTGPHYCAVATCGEILFGNGAELDIEAGNVSSFDGVSTLVALLCAALALSIVVVAVLIFVIKNNKYDCSNAAAAQETNAMRSAGGQQSQPRDEDLLVYSMPNFTRKNNGQNVKRGAKAVEGESIYADVRVLGLSQHKYDEATAEPVLQGQR